MRKGKLWNSMLCQKVVIGIFLIVLFVVSFMGIFLVSGGSLAESDMIAMRREGNHTKEVQELYSLKVIDASDTQAIEKLMYTVIDEVFLYRGWDNDTDPFSIDIEGDLLLIDYNVCMNRPDSFQRLTADYSAIFLALIQDIRQIQWEYDEIQYGGIPELKTLHYDWKMMQNEDFIDSAIAKVAKGSAAKDFGASASALQLLVNSFTYYERYKAVAEKKPAVEVTEEQMKQEILDLPLERIRSYKNMTKCKDIYVEGASVYSKQDYNREIWDAFYEKVQKGEPASVIVGGYNSLENAALDQNGSVYYCNIHYDGVRFHVLYDFVDSTRTDDFGDGVQTGKFFLCSESDINDIPMTNYYVCDDPSVSWRDAVYSGIYAGTGEFTPIDMVEVNGVMSVFH